MLEELLNRNLRNACLMMKNRISQKSATKQAKERNNLSTLMKLTLLLRN